jgi:hypothetical protein
MSAVKNPLQKAFIDFVASIQPSINKNIADELAKVSLAIKREGKWQEDEEWRISTWFDTEIKLMTDTENPKFLVRVECDGQEFKAICPSLHKAFLVSKFYQRIIVDQFYSVGPTWA